MPYRIATTVKQAAWECRWARAGRRLAPDPENGHPENLWICVHPMLRGNRRVVSEKECAFCTHWGTEDDPGEPDAT